MEVVMISGATLREFVEGGGGGFEAAVEALFREVDEDGDGRLSMADLWRALANLGFILPGQHNPSTEHTCNDHDHTLDDALLCVSERIRSKPTDTPCYMDSQHFHPLIRDVVLAIAHDLRGCPLQLLLHNHTSQDNSSKSSSNIIAQAIKYEQSKPCMT